MDELSVSQRWHDRRLFLSHFRRNPRMVGAIAPSSQRLARCMLDGLTVEPSARIVELGPGTGAVTGEIAKRLPPGATCLAVDLNPAFIAQISARWPRIDCVCDRAEHLVELVRRRQMHPVDHVVSGLPFASLPVASTRQIIDAIVETLRTGGTFTTFQYVHAYGFPSAVTFRRLVSRKMGGQPTCALVVGNVPPALVFRWHKTT
jgi:phosphatidylethanolamine/phosphatidyl-N-methylethanolamine N-methyltransferase